MPVQEGLQAQPPAVLRARVQVPLQRVPWVHPLLQHPPALLQPLRRRGHPPRRQPLQVLPALRRQAAPRQPQQLLVALPEVLLVVLRERLESQAQLQVLPQVL
ncbi:MAG: hypothetical protein AAFP69_01935 [Planctomycetota bacterium]